MRVTRYRIMRGAVNLATATASAINTKHRSIANISCLSMDTVLDGDQLMKMMREGFSWWVEIAVACEHGSVQIRMASRVGFVC